MFDVSHTSPSQSGEGKPLAKTRSSSLNRVFSDMYVTTGALNVRFDFEQQWLTVAFLPWFDWHIDSVQAELAPGLVHFIEPDGRIVGVKIFPQATDSGGLAIPTQGDVS